TELPTLLCHVLSPPFWTSILWGPLSENFGAPHTLGRRRLVIIDVAHLKAAARGEELPGNICCKDDMPVM
ncbi:hypothetical protein ACIBBE_49510, partial [Streptomyces sp. NPDC051644]|uniref:hypothetical protein n=1 Tax=Streptomyces sp. NPDC051644 TaxID=3365666 RepID=UPI0037B9FBB8